MNGKTALITGASSGLGLEFSRIYSREGYNLVIVARSGDRLDKLKDELENAYHNIVYVCTQDLSEQNAAERIFNFTTDNDIIIHTLVNNAGFGDFGNFWEINPKRQKDLMQVNVVALVELTRAFLPGMIERREGRVLNVSSVASFMGGPRMPLYYASKGFILQFSEALSEETKGTGVSVTALLPGPTATGFEQAAQMKNSKMFTILKPASAKAVAEAGYRASVKGKPIQYHRLTKIINLASRISPRSLMRKSARIING